MRDRVPGFVRRGGGRRGAALAALFLCLGGCAAHEGYRKAGLDPAAADQDWAACRANASNAIHRPAAAESFRGATRVSGDRVTGALDFPETSTGGATGEEYLRLRTFQDALRQCMQSRGYSYAGRPAVEMF